MNFWTGVLVGVVATLLLKKQATAMAADPLVDAQQRRLPALTWSRTPHNAVQWHYRDALPNYDLSTEDEVV